MSKRFSLPAGYHGGGASPFNKGERLSVYAEERLFDLSGIFLKGGA